MMDFQAFLKSVLYKKAQIPDQLLILHLHCHKTPFFKEESSA